MVTQVPRLILDLATVLGVAAVITLVFRWLKQPAVLGYMLAGLIVGPHVPIPLVADLENVQTLAELGVVLLMFSVGLAGKVIRWSRPLGLRRVVVVCATVAGVLLIVRGLALGIPYLSPQFVDGQGPTCPCHR